MRFAAAFAGITNRSSGDSRSISRFVSFPRLRLAVGRSVSSFFKVRRVGKPMTTSHQISPCKSNDMPVMTRQQYAAAYNHGYPKTIGFMLSRGASRDISEDMAQAAWAKGWQYRGQIRDPLKVDSWVNSIAFNLFRGSFRQAPTVELLPADHPASPGTSAATIDCQRLLAQCSPSERELIDGCYVAGYTSAQLGRRLGCSAVAVRVRLLRLRRRLQIAVKPRAPFVADAVAARRVSSE